MEYTTQIIIIVITAFVTSVVTLMVNAGWSATKAYITKINKAVKQKIVPATIIKYICLALAAFAILSFISELKLLVLLMSCWCLLTSFFISKDYLLFTLLSVRSSQQKERDEKELNHLLFQLSETNAAKNHKRYIELVEKIKELR